MATRDQDEEIIEAINSGDLDGFKRVVLEDTSVVDRALMPVEKFAIHLALRANQMHIANWLIKYGVNLDSQKGNDINALMSACLDDEQDIVEFLIDNGASMEVQDKTGLTPVMIALLHGKVLMARFLIQRGANIHHVARNGDSVLTIAVARDDISNTALLVGKGVNLEHQEHKGWTVLIGASAFGIQLSGEYLIRNGANLNAQDNEGWTALMHACKRAGYEAGRGAMGLARILIQKGAKLDVKNNEGKTALMIVRAEKDECINRIARMSDITGGAYSRFIRLRHQREKLGLIISMLEDAASESTDDRASKRQCCFYEVDLN